jgi:L-rhamnose mutarotase
VETDDLDAAQRGMAATEVNARWQAEMAELFVGIDGRPPDTSMILLTELFHLDERVRGSRALVSGAGG